MKIEYIDEKIIVYLYKEKLCFDNIDILNKQVKELFVILIKKYHIKAFGYSIVHIYDNELYGSILEIEKIYQSEFNINVIDLKLIIHQNVDFYLEVDDDLFLENKKYFVKNDKYYINIKRLDNVLKYLEHGKITYKTV